MKRLINKFSPILNSSGFSLLMSFGIMAVLAGSAVALYQFRTVSTSQMTETMQKDSATNDAMSFARAIADKMQDPAFLPASLNCGSVPPVKLYPGYEVRCYTNGPSYMLRVDKLTTTPPIKSLSAVSMLVPMPGPSSLPVEVDGGWSTGDTCVCFGTAGQSRQTHSCTNPAPANAGKSCPNINKSGLNSQYTSCAAAVSVALNCRKDGGWSAWGACSKSCGGGTMNRSCSNPVPFGTEASGCAGASSSGCNSQSCCTGSSSDSDSAKLNNGASKSLKATCNSGFVRKSCDYSGDCGKWTNKGSSSTSCTGTWFVPKGACGGGPETGSVKIKCGCP